MKECTILFSDPMVRAILEQKKTQTRRVIKPQPVIRDARVRSWLSQYDIPDFGEPEGEFRSRAKRYSPYGVPGDRLWVRETWRFLGTDMSKHGRSHSVQDGVFQYRADDKRRTINRPWQGIEKYMKTKQGDAWRPSIHMPRWASRILLEVTEVRVECVQEIIPEECVLEGVGWDGLLYVPGKPEENSRARKAFADLWDSLNAKRGYSWGSNPWVWVIGFKLLEVRT